MNAIQPSRPPLQPVGVRRVPQKKNRHHRNPYHVMALETTAKLAVSVLLSAAAVTCIVQLLHYQGSQQGKLRELKADINSTQERVDRLQTEFNRYFDPQQAQSVMQEQSNRVGIGQRRVILLGEDK